MFRKPTMIVCRVCGKKAGYDGIILTEVVSTLGDKEYPAYIAFSPEQVTISS